MYVVPSSSSARRNSSAPSRVAGRFPQTPSSRNTRNSPPRRATRPTYSARLRRSVRGPIRARMSRALGLETRRLDALACEKAIDSFAVHTQHPPDADGVEPPVVDQAPNRLRMNAELVGDIANADQAFGLMLRRRHAARNLPQVTPDCGLELTYRHRARELRLDPPVRADEERPRLRGQMPFLVPA